MYFVNSNNQKKITCVLENIDVNHNTEITGYLVVNFQKKKSQCLNKVLSI